MGDMTTEFVHSCETAADYATGRYYGGDMSTFDSWLENLTSQMYTLVNEGSMTDYMSNAALAACSEILELDIPHEDHIKCIIWIRLVLEPDQPIEDYDDWPFDIEAYLDDDE